MSQHQLSTEITTLLQTQTKEQIYQKLLASGYSLEQISEGFKNLNHHTKPAENRPTEPNSNQGIYTIAIFGSSIFGLGIFSLVAANWQNISDLNKFLLILIVTVLIHATALLFDFKFKLKSIANSLYLAGSLAFGGSIFLISTIFNLNINIVDLCLIWFIGIAILGLVLKNFLQEYLGIFIVLLAGAFSYGFLYSPFYYQRADSNNYPTILLAFIATIIAAYWAKTFRLQNQDNSLNHIF